MWSLLTCVFLALLSTLDLFGGHFVSGLILTRSKRQAQEERREIDFDNIDESLYGWEPQLSRRCPTGQYMCRDASYCFRQRHMCNNNADCDDQSDEINANCGYTTTTAKPTTTDPRASERMESGGERADQLFSSTVNSTETTDTSNVDSKKADPGLFDDPLAVTFIALGGATLILGAVAAAYCSKHKCVHSHRDSNQITPVSAPQIDSNPVKEI